MERRRAWIWRVVLAAALVTPGNGYALPASEGGEPGGPTNAGLKCVEEATSSLAVKPTEISSGQSVTLTWSVDKIPSGCGSVKFLLDGRSVGASGSSTVQALATHSYVLRVTIPGGEAAGLRKSATVNVKLAALVDITGSTGQWKDLLIQAVRTPQTTIRLADGVDMDLSGYENVYVSPGVTITSERNPPKKGPKGAAVAAVQTSGVATAVVSSGTMGSSAPPPTAGRTPRTLGPRLYTKTRPRPLFHIACDSGNPPTNVRLFGFRLHGPHFDVMEGDDNLERGIMVSTCHGVEIANMELAGWSGQAIYVQDGTGDPTTGPQVVSIHDNFFHHNQHEGGNGYGVDVSAGGYAAIERNVFDFNRHGIAASGKPGVSYDARHNLVLRGGGFHRDVVKTFHTHQFDVHGDDNCGVSGLGGHTWNCGNAGDQFKYEYNAFQYVKDNAIKLRGKPRIQAFIANNVFAHDDGDTAIELRTKTNVILRNNKKEFKTFGQYGVCDIDGDGKDDLFLPTGVTWWYASSAKMHWTYLNAASERRHQLGLGDFDGDRRCDVFAVNTSNKQWEISSGATGIWKPVGNFGIPFDQLAFADFDGDGATDVFRRAPDGQWSIYSIKKNEKRDVQSSGFKLNELRFGDFDGDKKADVMSRAGGHWSISRNATGGWETLNTKLNDKLPGLLIADVNGNGKDDVVRLGSSGKWEVSWDGRGEWKTLAKVTLAPTVSRFAFGGRFDGSPGADLLAFDSLLRRGLLYSEANKKVVAHSLYAY